jgi:hypothetical protein
MVKAECNPGKVGAVEELALSGVHTSVLLALELYGVRMRVCRFAVKVSTAFSFTFDCPSVTHCESSLNLRFIWTHFVRSRGNPLNVMDWRSVLFVWKNFIMKDLQQHCFSHHAKASTGESAGTLLYKLIWPREIQYFLNTEPPSLRWKPIYYELK